MPIRFRCSCGKKLGVGDHLAGRRGRCPDCGAIFTVPSAGSPPPPPPPRTPPQDDTDYAVNLDEPVVRPPTSAIPTHAVQDACPSCGTSVPDGASFCPKCGFAIRGEARSVPVVSYVSDLGGARPHVLIERTAKKYKMAQLVGGLVTMLGIVVMTAPCWWGALDSEAGNRRCVGSGVALTLMGLVALCVTKVVVWWEHE